MAYSIRTMSEKPFDLSVLLLDSLDQLAAGACLQRPQSGFLHTSAPQHVLANGRQLCITLAADNTDELQADIRVRLLPRTEGCPAELLGGLSGAARNGSAVITGMRLRALKVRARARLALLLLKQASLEDTMVSRLAVCDLGVHPSPAGRQPHAGVVSFWHGTGSVCGAADADAQRAAVQRGAGAPRRRLQLPAV